MTKGRLLTLLMVLIAIAAIFGVVHPIPNPIHSY